MIKRLVVTGYDWLKKPKEVMKSHHPLNVKATHQYNSSPPRILGNLGQMIGLKQPYTSINPH